MAPGQRIDGPGGSNQGQIGHITRGGTQPLTLGNYGQPPVSSAQPVRPQLVTLQAPTGATFQVAAEKVAFYEQQGARRSAA